jgi:hypothetical protein
MKNMANLKKIATELFWKCSSPERLSLHHTKSLPQYQLGKMYFLAKKRAKFVKNREKLEIAHKMLVLEQNIPNQKFNNTFSGVQLKRKYFTLFSCI